MHCVLTTCTVAHEDDFTFFDGAEVGYAFGEFLGVLGEG